MTHQCFEQIELTKEEVVAIHNLSIGQATEHQQVLALAAIVKKISRAYDVQFLPGEPDATAFLQGRSFVGKRITKYINKFKDTPDET